MTARILGTVGVRLNLVVFKAGFLKKKPPVERDHQVLRVICNIVEPSRTSLFYVGPDASRVAHISTVANIRL